MEEYTTEEIAAIFKAAGDSVTLINGGKPEWETDAEWKLTVQRNVEHLEIIKGYKKGRWHNIYLDNRRLYSYRQSYC